MRLAVVGAGYVGLVTSACFAASGNTVACLDVDEGRVRRLQAGDVPIYEPGLSELIQRNTAARRLSFTTDYAAAIPSAEIVFLAVGTPSDERGRADLRYLFAAVEQLAPHLAPEGIVVTKSTVPVGTCARIETRLRELTGRDCRVASNPEFLKEGAAINDFQYPDRVVVGARDAETVRRLEQLYAPFLRNNHPYLAMAPESAELTKYVANAFLATKISFINEMANLCQQTGGDIADVRRGIGHDRRIGFSFLFPGVGYGGSCFPKDVRELAGLAEEHGVTPRILRAVDAVNDAQKLILLEPLRAHFGGSLRGARLAAWGLAFKPRTDDLREAPALVLLEAALDEGAIAAVHDPVALPNARRVLGERVVYADDPYEALDGAEALVILTEWEEFRQPDFAAMRERMAAPVIFDGRNVLEPSAVAAAGFLYHSIGRPAQ